MENVVASSLLPPWLPDWDGADEAAAVLNLDALRDTADALLDLVFADDDELLDSLPDDVQASVVPTLGLLGQTLEEGLTGADLVAAARLVRRTAQPYLSRLPKELTVLIEALPARS